MKNYIYIAFVVLYSCSSSIPDEYVQKIDRLTAELKKTKAIASLAVSKVNELEEKLTISIEERDSIIYDHKQETELLRASDSFHKGNNALFTKQYKKAIEHYLKTVQYRPNDAHAFNNLGNAYKEIGNYADAINCYDGQINNHKVILAIMNFSFIGGSMGSVVGELVSRAVERAREKKIPLILVCASGGARMQESSISLLQLAKTSSKLARFQQEGGLFIPILTDPTTGGVTASFGMLGDVILAEPGALIGFAGPRVIKQTIGEDLPEGFQTAEFVQEHGFLDLIIDRSNLKEKLSQLNRMYSS